MTALEVTVFGSGCCWLSSRLAPFAAKDGAPRTCLARRQGRTNPALKMTGLEFGLWRRAAAVVAELVPGFFVGGPAAGGVGGVEHDCGLFGDEDAFSRDDVPEVFGDDVNCDEIEVSSLMTAAGGADVAFVAAFGPARGGGFDLHAHEVAVGFNDGVVTGGVSPGIENLEAVFSGGGDELQLGPLAATFAILDPDFDSGLGFDLGFHRGKKNAAFEAAFLSLTVCFYYINLK